MDNIEKVLERGEKIELLVDKTDNLRFQVRGWLGRGAVGTLSAAGMSRGCLQRHMQPAVDCAQALHQPVDASSRPSLDSHLPTCSPRVPAPQADKFHKTGRQLRSRMWWQNMKMKLIVVFILILLAVIIFCAVCFSGGKRCF